MKSVEHKLEQLWCSRPPLWLRTLAGLYALGWRVYEGVYRLGLKRRIQIPVPVIGVGSLWAGGVGKTPITIAIARLLHESGQRVAVLTHGYGGRRYREVTLIEPREHPDPALVGDEAAELRLALLDIPIAVGKWRVLTAEAALARWSPEVLVLDDGFQHLSLSRTLDLVLLPAGMPLGNGYCLPAGPLREPPSGIRRAGGVVMVENRPRSQPLSHDTGAGNPPLESATHASDFSNPTPSTSVSIDGEGGPARTTQCDAFSPFTEKGIQESRLTTCYYATITPTNLLHIPTGDCLPLHTLQNRSLTLVCSIARPERFIRTARSLGYTIECVHTFPDHHAYTPDELRSLRGRTILTTAKDAVKLRTRLPETCDAYALLLEATIDDALQQRLLSLFIGTSPERRKL